MLFPSPRASLDFHIATSRAELTGAFELVYRTYLAKGYTEPHPGQVVYREVFGLPCSRTIVAVHQAMGVVGTLTVVEDNPLGLELARTYPREVQALRAEGGRVAEITCLAIDSARRFRRGEIFFGLTRFMIQYAFWRRCDDLLIAIHPRHLRFYRRYFRVSPLGPCRPHGFVCDHPSVGCRIELGSLKRNVEHELWRRYFSDELPKTRYTEPPIDSTDHRYLCRRCGIAVRSESTGGTEPTKEAA